jgi:acetolactate synthase-1/2/3 large subunit
MGFGISGGIGMAVAYPENRTVALEGDGGLSQNLQEFSIVPNFNANMKIFIADNGIYGLKKFHQKAARNNHYFGYQKLTGLWLPESAPIGKAFDIPTLVVKDKNALDTEFTKVIKSKVPVIFIVKVDPTQVIYPKIPSFKNAKNEIVSNPLHLMELPLSSSEFS